MIAGIVGRRGQITLPRAMRKRLNLNEGDKLLFTFRDGEVVIRPAPKTLLELRGSVKVQGEQDFATVRARTEELHAREVALHEGALNEEDANGGAE